MMGPKFGGTLEYGSVRVRTKIERRIGWEDRRKMILNIEEFK